jgi:DNA repair exonuclease SbcCD ATPase subunit
MHSIAQALHGSYAYLLIFQVILVASLTMVLLALIVRRIKFAAVGISDDFSSDLDVARRRITELEQEIQTLGSTTGPVASTDEIKELMEAKRSQSEKIKYLESKLLEYEILQEEISTLVALKNENEKLKETMVKLQKQMEGGSDNVPAGQSATRTTQSNTSEPSAQAPAAVPAVTSSEQPSSTAKELDNLLAQIDNLSGGSGQ